MGLEELKPEEQALLGLVQEYREVVNEMNSATHLIDIELENIQERRDDIAEPFLNKLAKIESKIWIPMLEYQHTFISSYGTVTYRKGAVRRTYNAESLDMLCNAEQEIKKLIWPFRTETISEPSISIKVQS